MQNKWWLVWGLALSAAAFGIGFSQGALHTLKKYNCDYPAANKGEAD